MYLSKEQYNLIGIIGQWLTVITVSAGIIIELVTRAHWGFCIITAGSLIGLVATKIRYYYRR